MRDLTLRDQFHDLLPLDITRWLRDQLTTHLDAVDAATDPTEHRASPAP